MSFSRKSTADWETLAGKPSSTVVSIDDAVTKKHSHSNATVINDFSDDGTLKYKGVAVASGGGSGDMTKAVYDTNNDGIVDMAANVSTTSTVYTQTDSKTAMIPVGWLYDVFRADRSRIYNHVYIDCQDSTGSPQNPTSLVVTMYVNGTLVYTSPAITTAEFTATLNLSINAGDLVRVVLSNTTGLTGSVIVSPRMVNR